MWYTQQLVLVISYSITAITSIQTNHRPPRFTEGRVYNINELPLHFDWEHGLRESTVQALYKENLNHANINHLIYSAPLLGKQTTASPFGDIAVLARGQLYTNHAGFIFVQDQQSTECDDCDDFSGLCERNHCQVWNHKENEHLIALWTVRRIRHRYLSEGPHYEIEYTISPTTNGYTHNAYLTKQGYLNYNIPGHIFVLRLGSDQQEQGNSLHHRNHKNGVFIAQTLDGSKYILQSFPAFLTSEPPRHYGATIYPSSTPPTTVKEYSEDDEKKIYQTLLEVLHKKTSPQAESFTPTVKPVTTLKTTTLSQVRMDKVIPLTQPQIPHSTKPTPSIMTNRIPDTTNSYMPQKTTTLNQQTLTTYPVTTYKTYPTTELHTITNSITQPQTFVTKTSPAKPYTSTSLLTTPLYPITKPLQQTTGTTSTRFTTQVHFTTPTQYVTFSQPMITDKQTIPPPITRPLPPKQNAITTQNIMSTTPQTTFHYYVAEEPKTTSDSKSLFSTTMKEYEDYDNSSPNTKTSPASFKTTLIAEQFTPTIKHYTTTNREYTPTFTTEKTGTIYFTTEPTTKLTPSYSLETDTTYASTRNQQHVPSTFTIPITVYDATEADDQYKETSSTPFVASELSTISQPSTNFQFPTTQFTKSSTVYRNDISTIPSNTTETKTDDQHQDTPSTPFVTGDLSTFPQPSTNFQIPTTHFTKPSTVYQNDLSTIPSTTTEIIINQTNAVDTTLGQTTLIELNYNTTEKTFYIIGDHETETGKTTEKSTIDDPAESTIRSTALLTSTFPYVTNPEQSISTSSYDDNISIHTTPTIQTETMKSRKNTKYPSSTESSNFLLETDDNNNSQVPLYQKPAKDYNDDDIFGSTKSTTMSTKTYIKEYRKSDIEIALFDRSNNRKSKSLTLRKTGTTVASPKVVYSDYFEASTIPMSTQIPPTVTTTNTIVTSTFGSTTKLPRKKFSVKRRTTTPASTLTTESIPTTSQRDLEPVTRQSYLTSISFEVNKRNKVQYKTPTQNREIKNIEEPLHSDIALRLIGEIKGAEYLDQSRTATPRTTTRSPEVTTKKRKYTRRKSYIPRSKRPTKKKSVKPEVT
ncbi:hypothetical protein GWI33_012550 [Rhynchophorus ferrugineus]|uniref:Uncharacterized protein n=1 Tax=Rhynchophorus ferrugineus TaxID=354439 RepID=A0A834M7H1_RHYFE|nr:hypothetical protein GWI33_012550 [Rhynchophorus ferrugineus]